MGRLRYSGHHCGHHPISYLITLPATCKARSMRVDVHPKVGLMELMLGSKGTLWMLWKGLQPLQVDLTDGDQEAANRDGTPT